MRQTNNFKKENRMEIEQATTQEVFEPTIEDMIQTESGIPTTTSLVIAQVFDKEHKNVLRDIQNLECSPHFVSSILSYTNIPRT